MVKSHVSKKKLVKGNVATSKKKMEDERDANVLGVLEEDELALTMIVCELTR